MQINEVPARYSTITYTSHRGTERGTVSGYNYSGYAEVPNSYNLTNGEVIYSHQLVR
jgi:hypothetical protein